jgi:hypothetical protein
MLRIQSRYGADSVMLDAKIQLGRSRSGSGVLRGPDPDTASQGTYKVANNTSPQGFSEITTSGSTLNGNKRLQFAQGRPMSKDASGSGANWSTGTTSAKQSLRMTDVESRFFFTGTVAPTDMSRATDKREKDRMGVFGTSNSYAGSYGRVTSESIGRDLNPLGRGGGRAFVAGALRMGGIAPQLPFNFIIGGTGNSINNPGCKGCGDPQVTPPPDVGGNGGGESAGGGDTRDYSCVDEWMALHGEEMQHRECYTCNCRLEDCDLCSKSEWQADPHGCFDRYCECRENNLELPPCCWGLNIAGEMLQGGCGPLSCSCLAKMPRYFRCCLLEHQVTRGWYTFTCNHPQFLTGHCKAKSYSYHNMLLHRFSGIDVFDCLRRCYSYATALLLLNPKRKFSCVASPYITTRISTLYTCLLDNSSNPICKSIACRTDCMKQAVRKNWTANVTQIGPFLYCL